MKSPLQFSSFVFLLGLGVLFSAADFKVDLPALDQSPGYEQLQKQGSAKELAKLIFLLNRYKDGKFQVMYDGYHYEMPEAIRLARGFLLKNYKSEPAEYWVQKYCYKTDAGNVIFFKKADGDTVPAKEIVLSDLEALEQKLPK